MTAGLRIWFTLPRCPSSRQRNVNPAELHLKATASVQLLGATADIALTRYACYLIMGDVALSVISLLDTTPLGGGGDSEGARGRAQRAVRSPADPPPHFLLPFPFALAILPPPARDAGDYTDNATYSPAARAPKIRSRAPANPGTWRLKGVRYLFAGRPATSPRPWSASGRRPAA